MYYMQNGQGRVLTEPDIKRLHKEAPITIGAVSLDYDIFRESLNLVEVRKVRGFWVSVDKYTTEGIFDYERAVHDVRIGSNEKNQTEENTIKSAKKKKGD